MKKLQKKKVIRFVFKFIGHSDYFLKDVILRKKMKTKSYKRHGYGPNRQLSVKIHVAMLFRGERTSFGIQLFMGYLLYFSLGYSNFNSCDFKKRALFSNCIAHIGATVLFL
jgi:hypothetical protein